jgi:hypothetical protein
MRFRNDGRAREPGEQGDEDPGSMRRVAGTSNAYPRLDRISAEMTRPGVALPANITGTIVRAHLDKLESVAGRSIVAQALGALPPEDAETLRTVSPLGWVPVRVFDRFYEEVAERARRDVAALHWEVGRECTVDTFRTVWRMLIRFTSDEALVSRTPLLYARTYDTGRLEAEVRGPGEAVLTLTGWPRVPLFVRRGLCVGISTVLGLAGRRDVTIRDFESRDGAVFKVRWSP